MTAGFTVTVRGTVTFRHFAGYTWSKRPVRGLGVESGIGNSDWGLRNRAAGLKGSASGLELQLVLVLGLRLQSGLVLGLGLQLGLVLELGLQLGLRLGEGWCSKRRVWEQRT